MTIAFEQIPSTLRTNFVAIEIGSTAGRTGGALKPQKTLLIGGRTSAGTVLQKVATRVTTAEDVAVSCGRGSTLHNIAQKYFENGGGAIETWFVSLDDDGAGVAATKTITVGGAQTEAGSIPLYIQGRRLRVPVSSDTAVDTTTIIAARIVSMVNALTELPVTAANTGAVVTLTAKNKGETGNDIDVRLAYAQGEFMPAGLTAVIAAGATGSASPDITEVWPVIGEEQFDVIVSPWSDVTNFDAIEAECERRWGPTTQNDGICLIGKRGTFGTLTSYGNARNSKHVSAMGADNAPNASLEWAGALAAIVARAAETDPSRPFQLHELKGILAPAMADRWTFDERNLLLADGISTYKVDAGGRVVIDRLITTYQRAASGADDETFYDVFKRLTMTALRYDFRTQWELRYPQAKISNDERNVVSGVQIVTQSVAEAACMAIGMDWRNRGLIQDLDAFRAGLEVEIDTAGNRVNIVLAPKLLGGLIVTAARLAFQLN